MKCEFICIENALKFHRLTKLACIMSNQIQEKEIFEVHTHCLYCDYVRKHKLV